MKHTLKLMLVASMAVSLFACEKDNNKYKGGRYYGSAQNLGNGTVRSFVDMDASGKPHQ
jgi:hypothetical protein